jgi:multidrug efflux pump subunit AcrA (membrane-fusion protein)
LAAQAVPAAPAGSLSIPTVSVATIAPRPLTDRLVATGNLIARQEALVSAEIDGVRVVELLADDGDFVTAGQVLARLSRDTLEAQLAQNDAAIARAAAAIAQANNQIPQAEAALEEAQSALTRTQALRQTGNATQEILEQRTAAARTADARLAASRSGLAVAQADKASAEAQRRELMVRLARTEIRAPVAGVISRRTVKVGAMASLAGEPMFRIIANGEVEFEAEILETQLPRLAVGNAVTVTPAGGAAVEGRIRLLPAEVDTTTRLGKVRVSLPASPALRVGAFARAAVTVASRTGLAVPSPSVLFADNGRQRVQIVRDGKVEERIVRTGIIAEGWTEILEGVTAGEQVIAKAGAFLRDGDAVRPVVPASATGAQ